MAETINPTPPSAHTYRLLVVKELFTALTRYRYTLRIVVFVGISKIYYQESFTVTLRRLAAVRRNHILDTLRNLIVCVALLRGAALYQNNFVTATLLNSSFLL
ncbi:hypothetical protein [Noviherbaspirillum saxi]|uniref:hypothetical protein n=1 Tax=Noviherbaspirillum saxi TaxID=2320863 RepID=UPI0011C4898F|nr:hypothetical protein [Noviherbaspirillum saxi]